MPAKYTHSLSGPLRAGPSMARAPTAGAARRDGRALPSPARRLPRPVRAGHGPGCRRVPTGSRPPASAGECDHDGRVRPAATLLRRRRWTSDHCRAIAGAASGPRTTEHPPELGSPSCVGRTRLPWLDSGILLPRWLQLVFLGHVRCVYKLRGARAFPHSLTGRPHRNPAEHVPSSSSTAVVQQ